MTNLEILAQRALHLEERSLNGMRMVIVTFEPGDNPVKALVEIHFHNEIGLDGLDTDEIAGPSFPLAVRGGRRIPAGSGAREVRITAAEPYMAGSGILTVTVEPIGDYSTYTLEITADRLDPAAAAPGIDPLFRSIPFKFRPGCFTNDCAPSVETGRAKEPEPVIDYRAKDFESFRHTLISAMMARVPNWQPTSRADLDMVLIDLISAAADELSDYQDRVINEAFFGRARNRVSLARHARLMDYHIHQGCQASTWLAIDAQRQVTLESGFQVWVRGEEYDNTSAVFETRESVLLDPAINCLGLYTWGGVQTTLAEGATSADLQPLRDNGDGTFTAESGFARATAVRDALRTGCGRLILYERLNPRTGRLAGRDSTRRRIVALVDGDAAAKVGSDPFTGESYVRVRWRDEDALEHTYAFCTDCPGGEAEHVALFEGNVVRAFHGRRREVVLGAPREAAGGSNDRVYAIRADGGVVCRLPDGPLAYRAAHGDGAVPPVSTLHVETDDSTPGGAVLWHERISLVHSGGTDRHFVVETDERGRSVVRFGNGMNGARLPEGATVRCTYQEGRGLDGNVGADTLTSFVPNGIVNACWNPFDVADGKAPEPVEVIIRRAPEAYSQSRDRAVTLADYRRRVEELEEVAAAGARYGWTGSWRTVRIAVDPLGSDHLTPHLKRTVFRHLRDRALLGEDIEIHEPRYTAVEVKMTVCVKQDFWCEEVEPMLRNEFTDGYTFDGREGFFHPDRWSFGRDLYPSLLIARAHGVQGVDRVVEVKMRRVGRTVWIEDEPLGIGGDEILRVRNDPDHLEDGQILIDVRGGRG
jgi:hypothetical protein